MKKTLYLMRHGQTLFNFRKKIQGACDSPLTEEGKRQARIAGLYFKENGIKFDHVYSSTQERASDTLEIVTDFKMPYERLKGIKEWNFGLFEGESEDLNPPRESYSEFFVKYKGESGKQVEQRMTETLTEIMERENHETVTAEPVIHLCLNMPLISLSQEFPTVLFLNMNMKMENLPL